MKRFIAVLFLLPATAMAQSVMAASGLYLTNFQVNLQYTVGELAIQTYDQSGYGGLTQGFHQPDIYVYPSNVGIMEEYRSVVKVYPNPTIDRIYIDLPAELSQGGGFYFLFASNGELVSSDELPKPFSIDLSTIAAGQYDLVLQFALGSLRFRVLKVK